MATQDLILIETLCSQYEIEFSFINALNSEGLIMIETIEHKKYLHQDSIHDLEKMIRLYHELNVNIEGIDIIFNLLQNKIELQNELNNLRNRLRLYED